MTRREFFAATAIAAAAGAPGARRVFARAQQPAPIVPLFSPIRGSVGYFTARGGTIGYLINDAGILVVDSQVRDTAALCLDGINTRSRNRRIDVLINTHHHADHTGGNGVFRPVTRRIVAHESALLMQTLAAERAGTTATQVYPETTFTTRWRAELGNETMTATPFTPAHTLGDVVVHFERANVVHAGDLVWSALHPFVDRAGGATVAGWIPVLERLAAAYSADAVWVFGHAGTKGRVTGTRADVLLMRDYLTALADYVRAAIRAGRPRAVIIASTDVLPGFEDFGPLLARAVEGTHDELAAGTRHG